MKPGKLFDFILTGLIKIEAGFAEVCLYGMIGLIFLDVILRYVVHAPTGISDEVSGYLLVAITFMGISYALRKGHHVKIDIVEKRLPPRVRKWLALSVDTLSLILIVVLLWQTAQFALISFEMGSRSTGNTRIPLFLTRMLVPLGLGVFTLETLRHLIVVDRHPESEHKEAHG